MASSSKFFRNSNDYIHFFGACALTILLYILGLSQYVSVFIANFAGLVWEWFEANVFIHWSDDDYWEGKPIWMRRHFSGDDWDWGDILRNFLGSILAVVLIILFTTLF